MNITDVDAHDLGMYSPTAASMCQGLRTSILNLANLIAACLQLLQHLCREWQQLATATFASSKGEAFSQHAAVWSVQ